ncbi:hypothetical protein LCGC14_1297130 [marine sediment metagenome]|uniref:Uncharacterized protein n=1 Tax=marine sediment metagenome TaxID=412755 RepID=A0A0F9N797_9ZZZZ
MAISEATVKLVKYPPECIPDSWFGNVPIGAEFSPPVLDLRRFKPYISTLANIQTTQPAGFANVVMRARYDDIRIEENVAALLPSLVGAWRLRAENYLYLNFFGDALVNNYTTHYGVWVFPPTIAHKLLYGMPLTSSETAISEELGLKNTVEKGLLPLPLSSQIEREYHVTAEETHSRSITIAVAGTVYTIEILYPRKDEVIFLTKVAAAPGTTAQDIRLIIDRDDDSGYAQLRTYALSLAAGGEVECFIPALRELRLTTTSTVAPGAHLFRYTFQRIKLTNILRVRFGMVSEDEVPGDLFKKVKGGVV